MAGQKISSAAAADEYIPLLFSILKALAIENQRMIPRQAVSTMTNVADLETYIAQGEAQFSNN